ncbi:MAG TPA: DUF5715 family protein [Terriglobales bacterium]|nr:DUF5715 family protein [Terriglobales bacterium]
MNRALAAFLLLTLAVSIPAFGMRRVATRRYHRVTTRRHVRRIAWNPLFRPSRDSLLRQNAVIDRLDLPRIQDDNELEELKASQDLVPIIPGQTLRIDPRLDPDRRYCRPWTRDFVDDLSEAYYKQFHQQIQINSAVRTVQVQKKLRRHNRNAAPETGETASSHLAGITVDIQRRGMTRQQVKWVEQYMAPMKDMGLIEPEEERRQWVFHVAVSDQYTDWRESRMLAGEHPTGSDDADVIEDLSSTPK